MDLFSCDGVGESQELGVQVISSVAGQAGASSQRLAGFVVQRIANEGMSDRCQMDSDLVRAAGTETYLKRCGAFGS